MNLFYNESLYYLLCLCAKLIFEKRLVQEILAKIVAANQIVQIFISAISPEQIDEIA